MTPYPTLTPYPEPQNPQDMQAYMDDREEQGEEYQDMREEQGDEYQDIRQSQGDDYQDRREGQGEEYQDARSQQGTSTPTRWSSGVTKRPSGSAHVRRQSRALKAC